MGLSALRWRRARRRVARIGVAAVVATIRAARAGAGAALSFGGLACAPAAAYVTWGVAGLLWVACPCLILAGAAVERGVSGGRS